MLPENWTAPSGSCVRLKLAVWPGVRVSFFVEVNLPLMFRDRQSALEGTATTSSVAAPKGSSIPSGFPTGPDEQAAAAIDTRKSERVRPAGFMGGVYRWKRERLSIDEAQNSGVGATIV
jgi:hypothetical protein